MKRWHSLGGSGRRRKMSWTSSRLAQSKRSIRQAYGPFIGKGSTVPLSCRKPSLSSRQSKSRTCLFRKKIHLFENFYEKAFHSLSNCEMIEGRSCKSARRDRLTPASHPDYTGFRA